MPAVPVAVIFYCYRGVVDIVAAGTGGEKRSEGVKDGNDARGGWKRIAGAGLQARWLQESLKQIAKQVDIRVGAV